jgi:hypothetical protein
MLEPMETKMRDFEIEWFNRCTEISTIELTPHNARNKMYDFDIEANLLIAKGNLHEFDSEEYNTKIGKIRFQVEIALNKAQTNFKNGESKRLKTKWSGFSGIIYFLKSIFGFYG